MDDLVLMDDRKGLLGEGPCWDEKEGVLYWVDIVKKEIHIFSPEKRSSESIQVREYVGAVVPKESGGFLVALQSGIYSMDTGQQLTLIAKPEETKVNNRFNDGKCDPKGRFWVGTMDMDGTNPSGALYCVDNNYEVNKKIEGVTISNGLAWDVKREVMYFIDTPTRNVYKYTFNLETGDIDNKEIAMHVSQELGFPDGMTIDEEGMLWIALWGGGKVIRCDPNSGSILREISLPVTNVTSCTFGGSRLEELYITTARVGLSAEELENEPYAGGLFRITPGVKGVPSYKFKEGMK
nr:SMP-30/gluconolactonase/LRE family protein [Evansella tamaricis]